MKGPEDDHILVETFLPVIWSDRIQLSSFVYGN
jgi:hypothetical protein